MKYKYTPQQLAQMADNPWLTDRERQVFDLHYRRGWAQEDVAAELYLSRRSVLLLAEIYSTKVRFLNCT